MARSVLTDQIVTEIRTKYANGGISQQQLAEQYGVGKGCIYWALHGFTWAHVKTPVVPLAPIESKLVPEAVREIRELRIKGWTLTRLAQKFDVSISIIDHVVKGRIWKGVCPELTAKSALVIGQAGSRLTLDTIRGIRSLHKQGLTRQQIADRYGVHPQTVYNIYSGRTLSHIT